MILTRYKKRGEIAVFLAMILSVLMALVSTVISGIRKNMYEAELEQNADLALRACFAEYNKELFDKYHLMYVDTSYKDNLPLDDKLLDHYNLYLSLNNNFSGQEYFAMDNFYETEIVDIKRAGDDEHENVWMQIEDYMKDSSYNSEQELILRYLHECLTPPNKSNLGYVRSDLNLDLKIDVIEILVAGQGYYGSHEVCVHKYQDYIEESGLEEDESEADTLIEYEEFLYECLMNMSKNELMENLVVVINEDIRLSESPGFELDACIYEAAFSTKIQSFEGYDYIVNCNYGY